MLDLSRVSRHRNLLIAGSVIAVVFGLGWLFDKPPPPETAEQIQADQAAAKQQALARQLAAQQEAAQQRRRQTLCTEQALCRKYAEARQACATAGDYKNCLTIKMGDEAADIYPCNNDGTAWGEPKDMPSRADCFLSGFMR